MGQGPIQWDKVPLNGTQFFSREADKPYALYVRGIRGVASIPEPDTSRLTALRQPLTACPLRTIEGDRTRKELLVNKVPLKQTAFPVAISMPDRQPFVGRSVINTHPSSRFLKSKESPPKVLNEAQNLYLF